MSEPRKRRLKAVDTPAASGGLQDVHTREGWTPAFPGQRPPFERGNDLAVTHGAYSARVVDPIAQELLEAVRADADLGFLQQPSYLPALKAWASAEARVVAIERWVEAMPIEQAAESKQGQTSPLELLRRWEANAATHRTRLGLDPVSRAKLGRDIAATSVDLASLLTDERERQEGDRHGDED